MKVIFNKRMLL